jgi:hypothetical protein
VRLTGASIVSSIRKTHHSQPSTSSTSARIDCNLHKGPNLTGIDPETDAVTPLFHPRQQRWDDHFRWDGIHLIGQTAVGRTTIRVLCLNSDEQLELRMAGE